jgi:hypothetical protein
MSDSKRGIWAPPVVSTLSVIATAAGNYQDPDHVIPNLLPPPLLPCPPCVDDRSPMSVALPSASLSRKAAASDLDERLWAPPTVITLPINATTRAVR